MRQAVATLLGLALLIAACHGAPVRKADAPRRCGAADARNTGLVGNGVADDAPALRAADAGPATFIYAAPEGNVMNSRTLTIRTRVALNKPLVLGSYMKVFIQKGKKLVLRSQLVAERTLIFYGLGRVKFAGEVTVLPEWWGEGSGAYDKMVAACAGARCTVAWTGLYVGPSRPINVSPSLQMWTGPIPGFDAAAPTVGFNFQAGDYSTCRPYILPPIGKFGTAIQATSTTGLRVYAPGIGSTDTAVVVQGDIAQTTIELGVIDKVRVVFGIAAASLRQSTLFGQFAVNTGDGPASLVEMRSAPLIEGSIAELTVSDGNTPNPNVALVRNVGQGIVSNLVFRITAWGGNFQPGINLVAGAFQGLRVLLRLASYYTASMWGPANEVHYGSFNGPWSVPMSADPNSLGERINNNFKVLYLPSDQIRGVWGIDEDRHFYVSHSLLSGGLQRRMILSPGPTNAGASNWYNPGLVVKELVDESHIAPYRLRITLTNKSNQPVRAATFEGWWRGLGLDWRLYISVPGVGST